MAESSTRHVVVDASSPGAEFAPLGLGSFALTTYVLSAHNAGWASDEGWVGLAFFYGGLSQLLAGMWAMRRRNGTLAATAFTTYGAFWMALGLFHVLLLAGLLPSGLNVANAVGWFLSGFFIFNTLILICATLLPFVEFIVFALLELTFLCLFIGEFTGVKNWSKAGGYFGVFTAAAAWYAAGAICFNATAGRAVLPMGKPMLSFAPVEEEKPWHVSHDGEAPAAAAA